MTLLARYDVAPKPIFYEAKAGPFVLYRYLEGKMWERERPSPQQLEALAEAWLHLNSITSTEPWPSRGVQNPILAFEKVAKLMDEWAETAVHHDKQRVMHLTHLLQSRRSLFEELHALPVQRVFSRSDQRFANVITRGDGRLSFVDWEDSGWHDPARSAADIIFHPNQEDLLTWREWEPFLERYVGHWRRQDAYFERRLVLYTAVIPLFWLAFFLKMGETHRQNGTHETWTINDLPAAQRIQNYLDWVESWPF